MGAWGVGLFSNDQGADVRDDFRDLIAQGLSAPEAGARLVAEEGVGDDPDDNDFWLALAAAQHRSGHVDETVIATALRIIDSDTELDRWDAKDRTKRSAVLGKLRDELLGTPPAPKKFRPRTLTSTELAEGDHALVTFGDLQVLLRVTGVHEDKGGRYPVAVALDWDGDPNRLRRAHRLKPILNQYGDPSSRRPREALGFILADKDPLDLEVIDARSDWRTPGQRWSTRWVITWKDLPRWFSRTGVPANPHNSNT